MGTIAAVLLVMAGALTLLPGHARLRRTGHRPAAPAQAAPDRSHPGARQLLVPLEPDDPAAPVDVGHLALLVLVTLAIPLFSMRLAFTDASNDPTSLTTRQAFDLLAEGFGPGFNGPLVVAAPLSSAHDVATMDKVDVGPAGHARHRLRRAGGGQRRPQRGGDHRLSDHRTPGGPDLSTGHHACEHRGPPRPPPAPGLTVLVGGETAAGVDASNYLSHRLPLGDRRRHRPGLPVADGGVPVGGDPGEGGGHEPAVGRRRLRGDRGRLPVGLGRLGHRHRPYRARSIRGSRS